MTEYAFLMGVKLSWVSSLLIHNFPNLYLFQEFDTPANLFALSGIFRGMCERSAITLDDIKLAAKAKEVQ